jgi:hypothetical protein
LQSATAEACGAAGFLERERRNALKSACLWFAIFALSFARFHSANAAELDSNAGLLTAPHADAVHWKANWIWPSIKTVPAHPNQFVQFRKTFMVNGPATSAHLAIFADSRYQLYVNDVLVGRGPAKAPVFWGYYDVFDVGAYLKPGKNVISAEVRWLDAPMGWYRVQPGNAGHGGLLCQLEIKDKSGEQAIVSDATWKAREDQSFRWGQPLINGALPEVEVVNGPSVDPDWTKANYDDSAWGAAEMTRAQFGQTSPPVEPFTHLQLRPMAYPLERTIAPAKLIDAGETEAGPSTDAAADNASGSNLSASAVHSLEHLGAFIAKEPHRSDPAILTDAAALVERKGTMATLNSHRETTSYAVLDFGKEVDGFPVVTLDAAAGTLVELAWSEVLTGDHHVAADRPGGNYVARYFTRAGRQTWKMWGWHGMRYLEVRVTGNSEPLKFRADLEFSTANLKRAGAFHSSDPLLDQMWEMGAYTLQLCSFDGTMDCPTREQREWVGDGEVELRVNDAVNRNPDLDRKFLLDVARDQRSDGAIPSVAASGQSETWVIADYMFSYIDAARWYYQQTGDRAFVNAMYPNIIRTINWFQAYRQQDGLLGQVPYWTFLGWESPNKDGESSILNALYTNALEESAELAILAGDTSIASALRKEAQEVRAAFNGKFWNAKRGLYVDAWKDGRQSDDVSQLGNATAVLYRFAPKDRIAAVLSKITEVRTLKSLNIDANTGELVPTTWDATKYIRETQTYGGSFLLQALTKYGFEQQALDFIRRKWGPMAGTGNGTFWEQFTESAGTSCHAWSAAPTYILSQSILGVTATGPAYSSYEISPKLAGLSSAEGKVPTAKGVISVAWKLAHNDQAQPATLEIHLDIPFAAQGKVVIPELQNYTVNKIALNGTTQSGRSISLNKAGKYRFEVTYKSEK